MANETSPQKVHAAFQGEAMKGTVEGQIPLQDLSKLREPIPIERVDFRIQSISEKGWAVMLAYKDARVDMDRLDTVLGPGYWQRKHEIIGEHLYCSVGIYNRDLNQWAWVQDVGTESNTEKEKGQASDSFKRACFNLGIGRELYSYPPILLQLKPEEFEIDKRTSKEGQKPKMKATYDLHLRAWSWMITWKDDPETGKLEVGTLIAHDDKGLERFRYPRHANNTGKTATSKAAESIVDAKSQSSQADASTTVKGWYNDFEAHKEKMIEKLDNGETTADEIIDSLKERFKVAKTVEDKIRNLQQPY